jgi:dipeptidyl aminopeptidase/acylaminoacyl peptidase
MSANKIKKPILLIHGEEDNNSGTLNMQVFIKENLMVQTYRSN